MAAIVAADPAAAEAAEKAALAEQFARRTRSSEHGMAGLYLRTDAAGIARLDATVAYLAEALEALGCAEPSDVRRAMAMVILADPAPSPGRTDPLRSGTTDPSPSRTTT